MALDGVEPMDDLEILANSRTRAEGSEAGGDKAHFSAVSALRWPLLILGIVVGLPVLFCVVFFSVLDEGHPPGIILPISYVFFVTPFAAPIGVWSSGAAFTRYPAVLILVQRLDKTREAGST